MNYNVGDTIGKYTIEKIMDAGGASGEKFIVTTPDTEGQFFMKEYISPKQSSGDIFVDFVDNQEKIIKKLNSMSSASEKFIDQFINNGTYYQVKELLNGINADEYLLNHSDENDRIQLCIVLTGIIRSIHDQGIVHQDLKPAQIMLVDDEIGKKTRLGFRVILSDFDWAIQNGNILQIMGTIMYKSPEHYKNLTPTRESDIFTLGIMIFEFLTGINPFNFDDFPDDDTIKTRVLNKQINKQPKDHNPWISDNLNEIILKTLEVDPDNRPILDEIQKALLKQTGQKIYSTSLLKISSGKSEMIVYGQKSLDRKTMKLLFRDLLDANGNPLYKYFDETNPMLVFEKSEENDFFVNQPKETKNHFLLNDKKVTSEKIQLKEDDKLKLYSSEQKMMVGELIVIIN